MRLASLAALHNAMINSDVEEMGRLVPSVDAGIGDIPINRISAFDRAITMQDFIRSFFFNCKWSKHRVQKTVESAPKKIIQNKFERIQ